MDKVLSFEFRLPPNSDLVTIEMPRGARVLTIYAVDGGLRALAVADADNPLECRLFRVVFGEGYDLTDAWPLRYIGSAAMIHGGTHHHVFEAVDYAGKSGLPPDRVDPRRQETFEKRLSDAYRGAGKEALDRELLPGERPGFTVLSILTLVGEILFDEPVCVSYDSDGKVTAMAFKDVLPRGARDGLR
jgi:hypothetical protein